MLATPPTIAPTPAGWLDSPELGPATILNRDFREAILAPHGPARRFVAGAEARACLMELTGGDPAQLDAIVSPAILADVAAEIVRRGIPTGPLMLSTTVAARAVRGDTLRRSYHAWIDYSPGMNYLGVVAGWRGWIWYTARAIAKADGRPNPEPDTPERLQVALDDFAALAAELTR